MRMLWSILRFAIFLFLGWLLFAWLNKVHWTLPWIVMLFCGLNIMLSVATKSHAPWLVKCNRFRVLEKYLRFLCFLNSTEPLPSNLPNAPSSHRALRSPRDFQIAASRAKQIVRGHDLAIEQMFEAIHQNENLRLQRKAMYNRSPLASFLLTGKSGIGKKHLCRVVAKLINRHGRLEVYDCRMLTPGSIESICSTVREQSSCFFLFENIEQASSDFHEFFERILTVARIKTSSGKAKFHESIVVFSTSHASISEALETQRSAATTSHRKTISDLLQQASGVSGKFLALLTDMIFLGPLSEMHKAEIASLLMQKTCKEHGVQLRDIAPEILAVQVVKLRESSGVELLPQQIKNLLRRPLLEASANQTNQLALRIK